MQVFFSLLTLLATLIFVYSLLSVLYPLKPFRSRGQALKGVGGSFVAVLALVTVVVLMALPQSVWRNGSILARSNSGPARPYMARLSVFRRLI
jgi:hypothetical protein